MSHIKRWFALCLIFAGLAAFLYFDLSRYLSFTALKTHREALLSLTRDHYFTTVLLYVVVYIVAVAISIPGAALLTITGGFLFGIIVGTLYVVISATVGSMCVFLAVRTALEPSIRKHANRWVDKMRGGFQKGAFHYLMVLRLVPLVPFWVVNIVPGLLGVPLSTFAVTTFLGIIPGSIVYVSLGSGLGHLFDQNQTPDMLIIFEPAILIPLIALAALSFVPTLYKRLRGE